MAPRRQPLSIITAGDQIEEGLAFALGPCPNQGSGGGVVPAAGATPRTR